MSQKQKVLVGVIGAAVVFGFSFVYSQFSSRNSVDNSKRFQENKEAMDNQIQLRTQDQSPVVAVSATPDATVDAIIGDASFDDQALQDEIVSEQNAVTASGSEINNVSQTYDENQL